MLTKGKTLALCAALAALCLAACDHARVYESYRNIPTEGWSKDSIAVFRVHVTDTLSMHNIHINLRNTSSYAFSNIYLFVRATSPAGHYAIDTLEYALTDQFGRWHGKGFSKMIDNRLIFRPHVQFPQSGVYTFEIQHGMRANVLPHVSDVGLRVEKTR